MRKYPKIKILALKGRTVFTGELINIKSYNPTTGEVDWCSDSEMMDKACPTCKDQEICPQWRLLGTIKVTLT